MKIIDEIQKKIKRKGESYVRDRNNSSGVFSAGSERTDAYPGRIQRKEGHLVLYPRDNTPGCTKQACGFAQLYPQFTEKGAVILGISKDSVKSHKNFETKYGLPFTLLSDTQKEVIQAYDVWKEKKNYGKVSMGVVRTTYLIDEEGVIIKAMDKVKAAENPQQMLEELS